MDNFNVLSALLLIAFSDVPPPDLIKQGSISAPFYSDVRVIVPVVVFILGLVVSGAIAVVCMKHRKYTLSQ